MSKKTNEELVEELKEGAKIVKVGGIYAHYKHPDNLYKIMGLAIQEATNKVCVIYRTEYGKQIIFIRDLDNWIEKVEVEGKKVPRFTLQ